jgi:hypothetical protein
MAVMGLAAVWTARADSAGPAASGARFVSRHVFRFDPLHLSETADGMLATVAGCVAEGIPGEPMLPARGVTLPVPAGWRPQTVRIRPGGTTTRTLMRPLACAPDPIPLSADPKLIARTLPKTAVYARRSAYPAFEIGENMRLRVDRRHSTDELTVTLHPVQVVPAETRLLVHAEITVEVTWAPALPDARVKIRTRLPRTPPHVLTIGDTATAAPPLNAATDEADESHGTTALASGRYDHLIIAPDALIANAPPPWNLDALSAARRDAGLSSTAVSLEWIAAHYPGRDTAERIRAFIQDAYEEWSVRFVLLVGTAQLLPTRNLYCSFSGYSAMIPSDGLYYGCLDGDFDYNGNAVFGEIGDGVGGGDIDLLAEVQVGRFPVADADELSRLVRKTLTYEAAPSSCLTRIVHVGEYLGFGGVADYATGSLEQIRLGATDAGFTSLGFENPSYGPFFNTDTTLYDAPGFSWLKAGMIELLNQDIQVINHLGHGNARYCFKINVGNSLDRQAIAALTNRLPYLAYSQACDSGRFDDTTDCFAEQFVTAAAGAGAAIMNTRFGWGYLNTVDGPSHRFHRMFWDGIFREQVYHLGTANSQSKERLRYLVNPAAGNVFRWCYYEITLFGDPATPFAARALRQPPAFAHTGLENQFGTNDPYRIEVELGPVSLYDPAMPRMVWRTSAAPDVAHTNGLTRSARSLYTGEIPAQPLGATVHYALLAETLAGVNGRWPAVGEQAFVVTPPCTLEIRGDPVAWGAVDPAYGAHVMASGATVRATAPARVVESGGVSRSLLGCLGTGSVTSAPLAQIDVMIGEPSTLTWLWQTQHALQYTSPVPGVLSYTAWFAPDVVTTSAVAPETAVWLGQTFAFAGWYLDGQRQPAAPGAALNPVPGIAMTSPRAAYAHYLPVQQDGDGQGIPDWWEFRYFGANGWPVSADDDGDGFDTAQEYADRTDPLDPASQPQPPVILHTPLAPIQKTPPPYTIRAAFTDSSGIEQALLIWRRNDGPWRTNTLMKGSVDAYDSQIPDPGEPRDQFSYRLVATDPAGHEAVSGPHTTILAYPRIALIPSDGRQVLLSSGGETETALIITNTGNATLLWSLAQGICESVASRTTDWNLEALGQPWRISAVRSASPPYAFLGQPVSAGHPSPAVRAGLLSPPLGLAAGARLVFTHWIDTELDTAKAGWAYDGGRVEISTDDGATFQPLDGPYTHRITGWTHSPWPDGAPCFAGDGSAGWQTVAFDLTAFVGQTIRLRFQVGGDNNTDREGWYLDDIRVGPVTGLEWPGWIACGATAGQIIANRGLSNPVYVMTSGARLRDERLPLHILSNDPVHPNLSADWSLKIRDAPWLGAVSARQTSVCGEGIVTLTASVAEADGEPLALEIACSRDGGASWSAPALVAAEAGFGECLLNAASSRVEHVATAWDGAPTTNTVSAQWATRETQPPLPPLSPGMLMRVRAASPFFASAAGVTPPFLIDNEAPAAPAGLAVTSHSVGVWSGSATMLASWHPASDGAGAGGVVYRRRLSDTPDDALADADCTAATTETFQTADGSNLWFAVAALDAAGNASPCLRTGPYRVDTTPPLDDGASVRVRRSPFGPYAVGPDLTAEWGGFTDALSGIAGYYVFQQAGNALSRPVFTPALTCTLTAAATGATNQIFLFAVDCAGNASALVTDTVRVLDPLTDEDGDGHSAADEELAGTDATDAARALRIGLAGTRGQAGAITLDVVWESVPGRRYTLLATPSLTAPDWRPIPGMTGLLGVGGVVTNAVTLDSPAFLRLSVAPAP